MASIFRLSGTDRIWDPVSIQLFWEPCSENSKPDERSTRSCSVTKDAPVCVRTRTSVDWLETPESHVFKADLPGLTKEGVKVDVEDGKVLRISGERCTDDVKTTDIWHRVERSKGQFSRKFRLPQNVQLDRVEASVENGVLTVTVPKAPEKEPEVRKIDVSWSK